MLNVVHCQLLSVTMSPEEKLHLSAEVNVSTEEYDELRNKRQFTLGVGMVALWSCKWGSGISAV